MLFPQLKNTRVGQINLNNESVLIGKGRNGEVENPLLDPKKCQEMIDDYHRRLDLVWSYGGWMENRQNVWSGSCLDEEQRYLHLGIDYNVKEGTEVAMPWKSEVIRVDHDQTKFGWGGRVIVKQMETFFGRQKLPDSLDNYFIFAHLDEAIGVKEGQSIQKGQIIGTVGASEVNGGWFSHLHIQAVTCAELERVLENGLVDLNGYGLADKYRELIVKFPDPMLYISLD